MKPTPLRQVLDDDLLLDRVGARLDTDDELGSLLLSLAHHVDAPISRPSGRARRRRNHRALTVLAALGIAVSGATVAAAIESAPDAPATAGGSAHTRFLPQALQALGLPFAGPGLAQGRLLLPPVSGSYGPFGPFTLTTTGLPASLLLDPLGSATPTGGYAAEGEQPGSGSSAASGPSTTSSGGRALGSPAKSTTSTAEADDGEREASGAPQNGATKTPDDKGQGGGSTPEAAGPTHTPTSSPTSAPTGGNAFAGTGNAGQAGSHAATPATPGSSGTPAGPATPARRSTTTPPAVPAPTNPPAVPTPAATTAASATPTGP
ncbi:MAG: hypothetical protein ABIW80_12845 [Lapillicoccus sp.]